MQPIEQKALLHDGRQRMIDLAVRLNIDPKPLVVAVDGLNEELQSPNPGLNSTLAKMAVLRGVIMAALYSTAPPMPKKAREAKFASMKPRCDQMVLDYVEEQGVFTPEMFAYLKSRLPMALGGKPNPGTPADRRLKENRNKPPRTTPNGRGKRKGSRRK